MNPILASVTMFAAIGVLGWIRYQYQKVESHMEKQKREEAAEYELHRTFTEIDGLRPKLPLAHEDVVAASCIGIGVFDDLDPEDVTAFAKKNGVDPLYESLKPASTSSSHAFESNASERGNCVRTL